MISSPSLRSEDTICIFHMWNISVSSWLLRWLAKFQKRTQKCCVLPGNFINIYKINRTLHDCLGIRILSSRADSISHSFVTLTRERCWQHSKRKFVSPRGHVIFISIIQTQEDTIRKVSDETKVLLLLFLFWFTSRSKALNVEKRWHNCHVLW